MRFYIAEFVEEPDAIYPALALVQRGIDKSQWSAVDGRVHFEGPGGEPDCERLGKCLVYSDNTDAEHEALLADSRIKYIPLENKAGKQIIARAKLSDLPHANFMKCGDIMEGLCHTPANRVFKNDSAIGPVRTIAKRFMLRQRLLDDDFVESLDAPIGDLQAYKVDAIKARLYNRLSNPAFGASKVELNRINDILANPAMSVRDAFFDIREKAPKLLTSWFDRVR